MGRRQINDEQTIIRLPAGTLDRVDAILGEGEPRAAFLRDAVERELKRRERRPYTKPKE
jgi:predicted DNA-binding protein